ncbi:hypothetical protein BDF21DRAFT_423943 [Thamnidium elegans]|nr:hypothetical protein BDF21DRAFT_423943 [Thamnidium elegans]
MNTRLLLGSYDTSELFNLYRINNKNYFCIKDINIIYLDGKLNTKANSIKQLFTLNPMDFIKSKQRIFVMTTTMIQIARLFNMYDLAELCKLSIQEIIGNVSEPLLNNIQYQHWKSATHINSVVEREQTSHLNGNEWIFVYQHVEPVQVSPVLVKQEKALSKSLVLYQWLSSNTINNSPGMIQTLISTQKMKKQQQAIIETRQRRSAFIIPTVKTNNIKKKKRNYQNIAGIVHDNFPPSPPPPSALKKRKYHQEYNLNLLATQATQMRGLPISPEVSPSPPPPLYPHYNTQKLPSIKAMLSELNNNRV